MGGFNPIGTVTSAMGKGGPSIPDYKGAAEAQGKSSQEAIATQTAANRPNQYNPFSSSEWNRGPDGQWTQNVGLSGGLGQAANNLEGTVGGQGPVMTGDAARQQAIGSAYNQAASRLDPQWQQRESAARNQLANEGLSRGDAAYDTAMSNLGRERNDAYTSAMNGAIGQGTQAGAATFQQNLASQMAPYQQLQMLHGLTQQASPIASGAAQPTPYMQAALGQYQGNVDQYNAQQAAWGNLMNSGAMMFGGK